MERGVSLKNSNSQKESKAALTLVMTFDVDIIIMYRMTLRKKVLPAMEKQVLFAHVNDCFWRKINSVPGKNFNIF